MRREAEAAEEEQAKKDAAARQAQAKAAMGATEAEKLPLTATEQRAAATSAAVPWWLACVPEFARACVAWL